MKKLLCLFVSLVLLLSLAACGGAPANTTPETTEATQTVIEKDEATAPAEEGYAYTVGGVSLTPGMEFDATALPEADDTFEIESCAGQGTDTVYSYPEAEVTVFNDGSKAVIYSIYLLDPNTATPEGLYLGDEKAQAETLYGTDYAEEDTELVYTKGSTQLRLLMEDDVVSSIEYRLITE